MEDGTSDQNFLILEWTIKNFSRWNSEIHGKVITSPKYSLKFWMELFPKGHSGHDETMVLCLHCSDLRMFSGEVSFIGSDGWTISTQQVKSEEKRYVLEFPPGPKFEKVVSQIRMNETLHKDLLTVKYTFRNTTNYTEHVYTKIDVLDVSLKISPNLLNKTLTTFTNISGFNISFFDGKSDCRLTLFARKDKTIPSKIELAIQKSHLNVNIAVLVQTAVLNSEGVVQRTEEKEQIFKENRVWTFFDSFSGEFGKRFCFVLQFKIIPAIRSSGFRQWYSQDNISKFSKPVRSSNSSHSTDLHPIASSSQKQQKALEELSKELMSLYQDPDFSDFTLKCDNVSIPVHKAILSARSPVFKTMLSSDMREATSSEVVITDLDPSTLTLFLTFLYTGDVGEKLREKSALNLYYATDKYQVHTLKKECSDFLSDNVSVSNVCDILSLANRHQDDRLTEMAKKFFLNHYCDILSSDEWEKFMEKESFLAVKILTDVGKMKNAGKIGSM